MYLVTDFYCSGYYIFYTNIRIALDFIQIPPLEFWRQNTLDYAKQSMSGYDAVDDSSTGIPTSGRGTERKCHRRLATSAFGGIMDIKIVGRDVWFDPQRTSSELQRYIGQAKFRVVYE